MKVKFVVVGSIYSRPQKVFWSPWHGIRLVGFQHLARRYGSHSEVKRVAAKARKLYPDYSWGFIAVDGRK